MSVRARIRRLVGQQPGGCTFVGTDQLVRDWTFRPSRRDALTVLVQLSRGRHLVPAPPSHAITPVRLRKRWALYFIYAPDGLLRPSHLFAMKQLRSGDTSLLVVFASPSPDQIPAELLSGTDALYWKGLSGLDFSGYAIGLHALAENSPGSDVFVMNDSVYGPFCQMDEIWSQMKWDLTGFTASGNIENHVMCYAFLLREWNRSKLDLLGKIFRRDTAYGNYRDVVFCQEMKVAKTAMKEMSVGSRWYADYDKCSDIALWGAFALLETGFPFLKKSLFTKYAHLVNQERARAALALTGYPFPPDLSSSTTSDVVQPSLEQR